MHFNIIHSLSDCTDVYRVRLNKEYTVEEFIKEIFATRKDEWGSFSIHNSTIHFGCSYAKGKINNGEIPVEVLQSSIKEVSANGGWSHMSYDIELHEKDYLVEKEKEKKIILDTVKATVEMFNNRYTFRKYLQELGLDNSDYASLYNAGGMTLTNISTILDDLEIHKNG